MRVALPRNRKPEISSLAYRHGLDLCDAISFAVLSDRRVERAFTFDHHLKYGAFQILDC